MIEKYFAYETLFRTLPILPVFIRKRIEVKHIIKMPKFLARIMMYSADLTTGFWWKNMDFYAYFRYYLFGIRKFIAAKLGMDIPLATNVKDKKAALYEIPLPLLKMTA